LAAGRQILTALADDVRFTLRLVPLKAPVLNGDNGLSQKAAGAGRASYYVSLTRLEVEGTFNGTAVTGSAWMDHEWFTHQLEENQRGWDWFSVQMDDSTELMLFQLRRMDGSIDPFSAGTFVAKDGRAEHLGRSDFELVPEAWWTSPRTGGRYPTGWRLRVPALRLDLHCVAAVSDQELTSVDESTPSYWEGAVVYSGSRAGKGYLEMTGYAKPMRLE
jgi:predicted secreted hydrolase